MLGRVMGFVGGGSNIVIATALPPSFSVLYCKHQIVMEFLHLIFYACLRLPFLDVETNPGLRLPVPNVCRLLFSNMRVLARNLSDLTVASSRYDKLLRSETLFSDMRHVLELQIPGFGWGFVPGQDASGSRDGGTRTRWIWSISPTQVKVWLLRNDGF